MNYFHFVVSSFGPGDTRQAGSYGETIRASQTAEDDPNYEFLREEVRENHFPDKPSRFKSSFVFEKLEDAQFFRDNYRKGEGIYRVEFTDSNAPKHRVCWSAWSNGLETPEVLAHRFWACPPLYIGDTEVFAESDLKILEAV